MKWINAEQQVTITIYDEEHEEHLDKVMTVEEMLDTYTNEGCPTIYSDSLQKTGKWLTPKEYCQHLYETTGERYSPAPTGLESFVYCSQCGETSWFSNKYCPHCGSRNRGEEE